MGQDCPIQLVRLGIDQQFGSIMLINLKNTLINLQEYNVILLYIMPWIIWCLTYDYIFHFDASFLILFFISLKKGIFSLSLSFSLYIYIYIYILFILF